MVTTEDAITTLQTDPVAQELLWSTIPAPALIALTDPQPPAPVVAAARALEHRALVLCYVVLDVDRYTPFDAHYFPTPDVTASRVSEPKNYRDAGGADPAGRTVLCAELPCTWDDATWNEDPDALAATTMRELARLGLPDLPPVHAEVRRVRHAHLRQVADRLDRILVQRQLAERRANGPGARHGDAAKRHEVRRPDHDGTADCR